RSLLTISSSRSTRRRARTFPSVAASRSARTSRTRKRWRHESDASGVLHRIRRPEARRRPATYVGCWEGTRPNRGSGRQPAGPHDPVWRLSPSEGASDLGKRGRPRREDPGDSSFPVGTRVMFCGSYGVSEDGAYAEWIAARGEDLCPSPEAIDDAPAGGLPVAYLTAQITLTQAGFAPGKTVLAPAIGGAVGNAATQLGRATGAAEALSSHPRT